MAKFFNVKITQGVSDGPYDIYYTTTGSSSYQYAKLYGTNNNAAVLTYSGLTTGDGIAVEVPLDVQSIVIYNLADDCEYQVTHYVVTPTPTPTVTTTPTPTPTSTIVSTYFYYFLVDCEESHNKIGRSLTNGMSNMTFKVEGGSCYQIVGSDNGPLFDYDLDSLVVIDDCSNINCQPTPTPTSTVTPTLTPTITITGSECILPHPVSTRVIVQCGGDFTDSLSEACEIKDMFNTIGGCTRGGTAYWDLYRDYSGDPSVGDKFYNNLNSCTVFSSLNGYVLMNGLTEYIIVNVSNGIVMGIESCSTPTPTPTLTPTITPN